MILNNLSILPFYPITTSDPTPRECDKWWVYGSIYPLFIKRGGAIPVQFTGVLPSTLNLYKADGTYMSSQQPSSIASKTIDGTTYFCFSLVVNYQPGRYYFRTTVSGVTYISDVITVVWDITPYLKLEWWDDQDFVMDAGVIIYNNSGGTNVYKNVLYLASDLAKPEYIFEEEGENRDGYFFPIKQISEKRYKFRFLAPEYLLDVMRFIRMSDHIKITYRGQEFYPDTFLMTPTWEDNGDLANVECEFDTNTVAKKIGRLITP